MPRNHLIPRLQACVTSAYPHGHLYALHMLRSVRLMHGDSVSNIDCLMTGRQRTT